MRLMLRRKSETHKYAHIEQVYRQLKQNHEDRKDYERASDFHFGEKEMRCKNPDTLVGLRFWLNFDWLVSGYGERWFRALFWTAVVLVFTTFSYLKWGLLHLKDKDISVDCHTYGKPDRTA